jgi:dGTPase
LKRLCTNTSFHFFESELDDENRKDDKSPDFYSGLLIDDLKGKRKSQTDPDGRAFKDWIVYARRWLMYVAVYRFSRSYDDIMSGNYQKDLFHDTFHSKTMVILKKIMEKFVYDSPGILKLELSSETILSFLLDKFVRAVLYFDCEDVNFKPSKTDKKYMCIFSDNYKRDYKNAKTGDEATDLYLRLLMVIDFISGMTDSYARTLYRELSGMA